MGGRASTNGRTSAGAWGRGFGFELLLPFSFEETTDVEIGIGESAWIGSLIGVLDTEEGSDGGTAGRGFAGV